MRLFCHNLTDVFLTVVCIYMYISGLFLFHGMYFLKERHLILSYLITLTHRAISKLLQLHRDVISPAKNIHLTMHVSLAHISLFC